MTVLYPIHFLFELKMGRGNFVGNAGVEMENSRRMFTFSLTL